VAHTPLRYSPHRSGVSLCAWREARDPAARGEKPQRRPATARLRPIRRAESSGVLSRGVESGHDHSLPAQLLSHPSRGKPNRHRPRRVGRAWDHLDGPSSLPRRLQAPPGTPGRRFPRRRLPNGCPRPADRFRDPGQAASGQDLLRWEVLIKGLLPRRPDWRVARILDLVGSKSSVRLFPAQGTKEVGQTIVCCRLRHSPRSPNREAGVDRKDLRELAREKAQPPEAPVRSNRRLPARGRGRVQRAYV